MDVYYTKTHEWVKVKSDDSEAIVGISSFAAKELGEINDVDLPRIDRDIILGDAVCTLQSNSASSAVYSPLSGTITAINTNLIDDPGMLSIEPENRGWLFKLENIDPDELAELMDRDDYEKYVASLS